ARVQMFQIAEEAGGPLDTCGSWNAFGLVRTERILPIRMPFQGIAEADGVFQGLTGTLRDVLQHRMRGVAKQRDSSRCPGRNRQAIEHRPSTVAPDKTNGIADDGAQRCKGAVEFVRGGPVVEIVASGPKGVRAEQGDLLQKRAAVNDVRNEMHFRPDPER